MKEGSTAGLRGLGRPIVLRPAVLAVLMLAKFLIVKPPAFLIVGLLFVLNLPPAIAAWIVGVDARRRIARGETAAGASAAQAGVVLGIVGTVLGVLAIVGWALALALSPEPGRLLARILAG